MLLVDGKQQSWIDRLLDRISPQAPPPPRPSPPPVGQRAWEESVDSHKVNKLTVHDVGLILFQESKSYGDNESANELLNSARETVAHAIMNADNKWGPRRNQMAVTASPIEPSAKELQNKGVRQAYDASLKAAREAYLSGSDPTNGATNFQFLTNANRSNFKFRGGDPVGLPLKTQSGPFKNSYISHAPGGVPSGTVYVNTYGND